MSYLPASAVPDLFMRSGSLRIPARKGSARAVGVPQLLVVAPPWVVFSLVTVLGKQNMENQGMEGMRQTKTLSLYVYL